jgi:hypothetical protein
MCWRSMVGGRHVHAFDRAYPRERHAAKLRRVGDDDHPAGVLDGRRLHAGVIQVAFRMAVLGIDSPTPRTTVSNRYSRKLAAAS